LGVYLSKNNLGNFRMIAANTIGNYLKSISSYQFLGGKRYLALCPFPGRGEINNYFVGNGLPFGKVKLFHWRNNGVKMFKKIPCSLTMLRVNHVYFIHF